MNLIKSALRHIIIKLTKVKNKERILRQAKERSYIQRNLQKTINGFLNRNCSGQEKMERHIQNTEKNNYKSRFPHPVKMFFRNEGRKRLPKQIKA